jgi:hypothetical protein
MAADLAWEGEALRLPDGSHLLLHSEHVHHESVHWWVERHPTNGRSRRIPAEHYPVNTGRGHTTKAEARRAGLAYARSLA